MKRDNRVEKATVEAIVKSLDGVSEIGEAHGEVSCIADELDEAVSAVWTARDLVEGVVAKLAKSKKKDDARTASHLRQILLYLDPVGLDAAHEALKALAEGRRPEVTS